MKAKIIHFFLKHFRYHADIYQARMVSLSFDCIIRYIHYDHEERPVVWHTLVSKAFFCASSSTLKIDNAIKEWQISHTWPCPWTFISVKVLWLGFADKHITQPLVMTEAILRLIIKHAWHSQRSQPLQFHLELVHFFKVMNAFTVILYEISIHEATRKLVYYYSKWPGDFAVTFFNSLSCSFLLELSFVYSIRALASHRPALTPSLPLPYIPLSPHVLIPTNPPFLSPYYSHIRMKWPWGKTDMWAKCSRVSE